MVITIKIPNDDDTTTDLRSKIERAVEGLLAILDGLDLPTEDREDENDLDADAEPSLGSVDNFKDQTKWYAGGTDDAEGDEHDGREPDEDAEPDNDAEDQAEEEPTLGWQNEGPQMSLNTTGQDGRE